MSWENPLFKILASSCSLASWFELYLVQTLEERFSRDVAHMVSGKQTY